ncbi:MAG TPA: monovalent cation/H+ antiporter complex subunit F [Kiritimatiellia bacterium]|nr:monovalent cation/H+ antiporter complex subunit F [Kiritimatiellia bacterium]HMP34118.1 monovalent cation/H+ antiporter complex subunit F [Kiritimatiellia bacterium]
MDEVLRSAAGLVVIAVALGLIRIFRGSRDADRMMAVQLIGTGGIAVMLLLAVSGAGPAAIDVALTLALLAAFASVAFVKSAQPPRPAESRE